MSAEARCFQVLTPVGGERPGAPFTPNPPTHTQRIPSSKGAHVRIPASTNRHTHSAFMAPLSLSDKARAGSPVRTDVASPVVVFCEEGVAEGDAWCFVQLWFAMCLHGNTFGRKQGAPGGEGVGGGGGGQQ